MTPSDRLQKRLTKIVCTIGPACFAPDQLEDLVKSGMNVARFNLTHAKAEKQLPVVNVLKKIRETHPVGIGILLDIRCAQVRTGVVEKPVKISMNQEILFGVEKLAKAHKGKEVFITVDYPAFGKDVSQAENLLIDNGELSFDIVSISPSGVVRARALQNGNIGSRRHVNMPGANISLPTFTDADWEDMACAVRENIDFLAISFVRSGKDIDQVRAFLHKKKSTIRIIAKIETRQAVANFPAILKASDGIMVARGDLGAELPFEQVPVIQDQIVAQCRAAGKPVIVATHMLESMIEHPLPTRAEVTDVAHAATIRTDTTMLSGETASGRHPLVAVDAMDRILRATEEHLRSSAQESPVPVSSDAEARAQAAITLARSLDASAIVVMSKSGRSAEALSKFRPMIPIVAITDDAAVWSHLSLHYGVSSLLCSFQGELETCVVRGMKAAVAAGLLKKGKGIVLVTGTEITGGSVISVQAREVR
ncbi:pyruvate kinase [candidate division WOR-1 bacterium RIFCSPHIGHO2_01_FULL_53_15]|uniref:Pyruvate kinase n=1 Tax=candidate division WOR-1 bacterium RIFCSPHIGHO2_01_FULL_53_15 TaxID=1802564 RepID=A0A1F4PZ69_UNCSA|nr:MAG: pyruvate kinase [candidate division WOR-1 bacterium RIFCSPHIGHO2_01_FULL_53_15]OGJ62349.1 MAG: pyruvate kinase [Candidatus Peribacteria bacterium RIFCSPHIGHO2_02_FULL_53_20]OGJ65761.1 MAG: pyruvate kinase [Candidatus Peribacteria bacterium RIFCSPLOWO2_01_FULL_53_10]OGJ69765.1 MAG: pyruvate kinase [Candidatus Peribacteria bacterium RIFCSPLOWO2_12_FULL_53_10]